MTLEPRIVTLKDLSYPDLLKEIYDPPQQLFYYGDLNRIDFNRCISIVGSRKHSRYGEEVIKSIINSLATSNITIISGLALGVDTLVHRCCLDWSIRTMAVLPLGINNITPISNRALYWDIRTNGGVCIAEDLSVKNYHKYHFPRRNRIIAGLSKVTLVIEAGLKSGALVTANMAFHENRTVFAIPGSVFSPFSLGTNALISQSKAQIYTNIDDLLYYLDLK